MPGSHTPNTVIFPTGPLPQNYFAENRSDILLIVAVLFFIIETAAFGLRVAARRLTPRPYGWDDTFTALALVTNLAICTLAFIMIPLTGIGHHTLTIALSDPQKLVNLGKSSLLALPILYLLAVAFSKLSILHLYLQIFSFGFTRRIIYILGIVVILQTVAGVPVVIFQCNPVSLIWRSEGDGTCIDSRLLFTSISIPNVGTDLVMLVLPLPVVWNMKATVKVKVGVTITLLTASIGIIASILRMVGFIESDMFKDPAWLSTDLVAYSVAEPGMYFLATCFPTYRPLIRYFKHGYTSSVFVSKSRYRMNSKSKNPVKEIENGNALNRASIELT